MPRLEREELAALSFGLWCGQREISQDPKGFLACLAPSGREMIGEISRRLFSPPHANIRRPVHEVLKRPVDALYGRLAFFLGLRPVTPWPREAPYAVCLTHDVDRITFKWHAAIRALKQGRCIEAVGCVRQGLDPETDPFYNFRRIHRQETSWEIRSAIYPLFEKHRWLMAVTRMEPQHVLGVYDPFPIAGDLRLLADSGFEIGLHGSFDVCDDPKALPAELAALRRLMGQEFNASGLRNHYLLFDMNNGPEQMAKAGLEYDSTLGFNFTCGFRCGTAFPFPLFKKDGRILLELPLNVMDTALIAVAFHDPVAAAESVVQQVRSAGGLLVINWHQRFCNVNNTPWMFDWVERTIVEARHDGAWISTPAMVAKWWMERM